MRKVVGTLKELKVLISSDPSELVQALGGFHLRQGLLA